MVELPSALWLRQFIFVRELSTAIITWHIKEDRQFLQAKVVFTFISARSINNPEAVSGLLVNDRPLVSAPAPVLKWFYLVSTTSIYPAAANAAIPVFSKAVK